MISVTRRYHFPASHRLHSSRLSEAENARLYGKCNNPYGHGHDYVLELTVSGEVNPKTGLLIPLPRLDLFVAEKILRLFSYRYINVDVPEFESLVPTTENIVRVIGALVLRDWQASFGDLAVYPSRVHMQETGRNGVEQFLPVPEIEIPAARRNESVIVHA
jgi:6-pyruvoyltetrahydropterin/6-carboxytetrahydropterin synthase